MPGPSRRRGSTWQVGSWTSFLGKRVATQQVRGFFRERMPGFMLHPLQSNWDPCLGHVLLELCQARPKGGKSHASAMVGHGVAGSIGVSTGGPIPSSVWLLLISRAIHPKGGHTLGHAHLVPPQCCGAVSQPRQGQSDMLAADRVLH